MKEKMVEAYKKMQGTGCSFNALIKYAMKNFGVEKMTAYFEITKCVEEGLFYLDKEEKIWLPEEKGLVLAKVVMTRQGGGYAKIAGFDDDLEIPKAFVNKSLSGDKVFVKIEKNKYAPDKKIAKVVKVVSHSNDSITGQLSFSSNGKMILHPDDPALPIIHINDADGFQVKNYDKLVVKIDNYDGKVPVASIVEVLGSAFNEEMDIKALARRYHITEIYPNRQVEYAKKIPQFVTNEEMAGRRDLRGEQIITIDGDDTRDFDDAVSISENKDGTMRLGVHIADVGHYVGQGGVLDEEAFNRATSVYFPNRVYPMLPFELSNGICSLNPNVDRLALTVFMDIDENGNVVNHEICESVIQSKERMTYNNVYKILQNDNEMCEKYANLVEMLKKMEKLSDNLTTMRKSRGELSFNTKSVSLKFDENNNIVDVKEEELTKANKIIESFMLVANETIAEHFNKLGVPFVYRVHEEPLGEKLDKLAKFAEQYNIDIPFDKDKPVTSADIQKILKDVEQNEKGQLITNVALRTMRKAKYSPENLGHFALSADYYCHFTSPIRRYPDLCIHRIIKKTLNKQLTKRELDAMKEEVAIASQQSSNQERNANDAQRASVAYYICKHMEKHVGKTFGGTITNITDKKIYITLSNAVDGVIRRTALPHDEYVFDEEKIMLKGKNHTYCLGDKLNVIVNGINAQRCEIELKEDEAYVFENQRIEEQRDL